MLRTRHNCLTAGDAIFLAEPEHTGVDWFRVYALPSDLRSWKCSSCHRAHEDALNFPSHFTIWWNIISTLGFQTSRCSGRHNEREADTVLRRCYTCFWPLRIHAAISVWLDIWRFTQFQKPMLGRRRYQWLNILHNSCRGIKCLEPGLSSIEIASSKSQNLERNPVIGCNTYNE